MALTYSLVGIQAALDEVEAAVDGEDWATAYKRLVRYAAIYAGLPDEVTADGVRAKFPKPEQLRKLIDDTRGAIQASSDVRRVMHGRTNYGSPSG